MPDNSHDPLRGMLNPVSVTFLAMCILVAFVIIQAGGDPLALARIGTRYSLGDPAGTQGYDGQFVYYIALDPHPKTVLQHLDVPAYRYQRILLPWLARLLSLARPETIPWALAALGILSQTAGVWAVSRLIAGWGANRWYALAYGLWAGASLGVRLDLPEPLAYALVAGAILAVQRKRKWLGWIMYSLALFTKEVTILFVLAQLVAYLLEKEWRSAAGLSLVGLVPYALFQTWLWRVFGQPGIASGGAMATSFEVIPFMGLWRIGAYSLPYLLAMALVFLPSIGFPAVWGIWASVRCVLNRERNVVVLGLLVNSLAIPFLPFSTFRETGGLLRFATGLVLAVVLFANYYQVKRAQNYSLLWTTLNIFLLK
jgi:hypothetical protein